MKKALFCIVMFVLWSVMIAGACIFVNTENWKALVYVAIAGLIVLGAAWWYAATEEEKKNE